MTKPQLSPAAQVVLQAVHQAMAEQQFALSGVPDYRQAAAAALRAVADQVVPQGGPFLMTASEDRVRHHLLAIAAELEGQ